MSITTTRRRRGVALLAAAAVTAAALGAGTSALFTDTEAVNDNTFTSGTLDLTATHLTQRFNVHDMAPGDRVAKPIALVNTGTVQLNWTPSVRTTGGELSRVLKTQAFIVPDAAQCTPVADATDALLSTGGWGEDLERTFTGDVGGVIVPGRTTVLCVTAELDRNADIAYSGADASLEWVFDAEQDGSEQIETGIMSLTYNLSAPECTVQSLTVPVQGVRGGTIDWGDGTKERLDDQISHTYPDKGTYTVTLNGSFEQFGTGFIRSATALCLTSVNRWDQETGTTSMAGAFMGAKSLTTIAQIPSGVTDMSFALEQASMLTSDLSTWDTSKVTTMRAMFRFGTLSPVGIENWDTSKVTNMEMMFMSNTGINRDLSRWNTSAVTAHGDFDGFTPAWVLPKPTFAS